MKITIALTVLAVLISFGPLFLSKHHGEGVFGGADGQAKELISRVRPEYKPWFSPLWTPPSDEVESLLFALQAAFGSGVLFYYLGYVKGRSAAAAASAKQDDHASVA